jgi:Flp pilus assembly protein TadB
MSKRLDRIRSARYMSPEDRRACSDSRWLEEYDAETARQVAAQVRKDKIHMLSVVALAIIFWGLWAHFGFTRAMAGTFLLIMAAFFVGLFVSEL